VTSDLIVYDHIQYAQHTLLTGFGAQMEGGRDRWQDDHSDVHLRLLCESSLPISSCPDSIRKSVGASIMHMRY